MGDSRGERRPPPTGTIMERVVTFKLCGRSAQMLLLENGCWKKLNEWTQSAIASKDVPLIKEILNLLLIMPTSISQLMENTGGLPLTVEKLLKCTAGKKSGFHQDVENDLKFLCASVFAKWLKVKKRNSEETDEERIRFVTETGGEGGLAKIAYRPGVGFLAVNGKISVVELENYCSGNTTAPSDNANDKEGEAKQTDNPADPDQNEELMEVDNLGGNVGATDAKLKTNGGDAGADFSASTNDDDSSSTTACTDKPKNSGKIFITSKSRSANLLHEMLTKPKPDDDDTKSEPAEGAVESEGMSSVPSCKTNLRSIIADYDLSLEEIEGNLWKNLNDDIEDDDSDTMCIDESLSDEKDEKNAWKLNKIRFTAKKRVEVEVRSKQHPIQKLRESMAVKVDLSPDPSSSAMCPADVDDEELHEKEDKKVLIIPTEDTGGDEYVDETKLFDYSMEKWPEPVEMDVMEG